MRERIDIKEFIITEKETQEMLDIWYKSLGWYADRSVACIKYDCRIGNDYVEEKARIGEFSDILVELIQDIESNNPGWFFTTGCDYLHYAFTRDRNLTRVLRIKYPEFKNWLITRYWKEKALGRHGKYLTSSKGYGLTLNLKVPILAVPLDILDDCPVMIRSLFDVFQGGPSC